MSTAEMAYEKREARLMKGVWSVLVEQGDNSDTYIFKTEAEARKWREATFKCEGREELTELYVFHVIFIPFRTYEESMEKFREQLE